jgi:hypothetical protein
MDFEPLQQLATEDSSPDSINKSSPASPDVGEDQPPDSKRPKIIGRAVVDSVKTSVLLAAHRRFYAEWSNGRKKAGSQVIPKEIWPKVSDLSFRLLSSLIL